MFNKNDYENLHALVFRPGYPGYKPEVKEIPNGDGKIDADKRFAHVAPKYLTDAVSEGDRIRLMNFLFQAHAVAERAASAAGISREFMPDVRYGALRVLDYPPGAVSNAHEDFDLFTLMCYRDQPEFFRAADVGNGTFDKAKPTPIGLMQFWNRRDLGVLTPIDIIRAHNRQAHLGQLGEAIGLGRATIHEVLPSPERQCSIVYFAIPDHDSLLPPNAAGTRVTVRDWLNERMARSRTEFKKYE